MNQDLYQISCICQHTWVQDNDILKFQRISAKHFFVKSQIKSMFATNCIVHCKIQMIFMVILQNILQCMYFKVSRLLYGLLRSTMAKGF